MPAEINRFLRKQPWCDRGKGPNGRNLCYCGCGNEVAPPRRTCFSDACHTAWAHHSDLSLIRSVVHRRDRGVCALCGTDTYRQTIVARETHQLLYWLARRWADDLQSWWHRNQIQGPLFGHYGGAHEEANRVLKEEMQARDLWDWYTQDHSWEADHIIPVIEGGGGCGPEGYRTLCMRCHHGETAKLAARRAVARRIKRQPELDL